MKRLLFSFWVTFLLNMLCVEAFAYDIEVNNADGVPIFYKYINDGKELAVVGDNNFWMYSAPLYSGSVVIPEMVTYAGKTFKVTEISSYTFLNCSVTNVSVPNSVTTIGESAFCNCHSLTSISIPNNLTVIENNTFSGCDSLAAITIPNSVISIGERAFVECI